MITIERLGEYKISEDVEAKNVYIYPGEDNILMITRVYSTEWLCSYEMVNYPFDTQVSELLSGEGMTFVMIKEMSNDFYSCWNL